jgi:hypothetical protein
MKFLVFRRSRALAPSLLIAVTLAIATLESVHAEDNSAPDVELQFRFLKVGLSRKAAIKQLGDPTTSIESRTLSIRYDKLTWLGPDGRKFVAGFVANKLVRWRTCTSNVAEC